jgi:hypothetical protein
MKENVSGDNGQTWDVLHNFGYPVIWLALNPSRPDTLYASVIHSTDGGAAWQDRSAPNMHYWTKDVVIDPYDTAQST